MNKNAKIYVAGHRGLVGSALVRALGRAGYQTPLTQTRQQCDLTNPQDVHRFFEQERPEYVFLAAAKVGGIQANDLYPADFIRDNLNIQNNLIHTAWETGVKKLLFLGSSCIYPKYAPQPMKEESLLTGALEPTNQWYAVAKIAGIKMCQAYRRQYGFKAISLMPTNLYGPGDNFDLETSHVVPALIRKFHEAKTSGAKTVTIWGTGTPSREFLHVDDMADASLHLMNHYDDESIVNVGVGHDVTIAELASLIKDVIGFQGDIVFDPTKPDGTPKKLLDVTKLSEQGWKASIDLRTGLTSTYDWFQAHQDTARQ